MSSGDYYLCGWRVRSELPLPELIAWNGPQDAIPDIVIRGGEVPEVLPDPVTSGRHQMVGADGAVLLHIAGLVRMVARGGREVTVQLLSPEAADGWRVYLLGSVMTYLCHQRGVFPLHAATLRVGGRAVAIAGNRGDGKSTLALALARAGHELLSDDLTVLRIGEGVEVLPAFPRLKLWRASLDAAGIDTAGLSPVRAGIEKFDLRPRDGFDPTPAPLHAILILTEGSEPSLERLSAVHAVPALRAHIPRLHIGMALGRRGDLFIQTARLVRSIPVQQLIRPKRFDALADAVALVERAAAE